MLPSPCYIFSDAHLGVARPERERELLAFLRSLRGAAGSLVVNGDLFDFWFEWRSVMPRRAFRVLAALADLRDDGVPVLWMAGNHDCWGGDILREDVGVEFHVGPWEGTLAGWHTRIEHGDGLRPREDRGYRAIRPVLRHPLSVWAFRLLHPDFASRLAHGSSHGSRALGPGDGGVGLRRIAFDTLARDPSLELVVFGHSHARMLDRAEGGGVYANPGAWLDEPTYLRVDEQEIAVLRWNGSAEGDRLHALDRRAEEALRHR
ncbi:Calcineurin-like phosphoesterase superfamily domain protein [Gemmatirosa kalamazoonensis]|uniref:Calcineurin-like phosphoesterase superfamily domain protein n=1 Tax=Gemmatirosa kalamazoonensis TaxID=861299 RepID=W0RK97_9BACT|nr:UDP-2,3-diacylglucosamine diphosphatase [Gemmatirosa kalamazoonensis]AHG90735.1 Calcineurin-like phosphoesterase superfamily domain protein [Gemmatirosa kalamazoonensis]